MRAWLARLRTALAAPISDVGRPDVRGYWVALALMFTLAVRLVPTLDAVRPIVFEDEIGYLANGRLLAGLGAADLGQMGSYQAGWSLVLVPVFWATHNPAVIYRMAVAIAMLAGWATVFPVAGLLRRATSLRKHEALVVSALGCLTPGSVLMGGYVYSEGLLTLVFATGILLVFKFWERPSVLGAVTLAACAGYLSAVHGRMIMVPVLVVIFLLFAVVSRKSRPLAGLAGIAVVLSVVFASRQLDAYVISRMYDLSFDRLSQGISGVSQLTRRGLVVLTGGQIWYLLVATGGLVLVGAAVVGIRSFRELAERRFGPWTLWALAASSIYVISSVNFARSFPNPIRLDYLSYGRYVDVFAPPLVALALGFTVTRPRASRIALVSTAVFTGILAVAFFKAAGSAPAFAGKPIAALSVAGVAWAIEPGTNTHPVMLATIGAVIVSLCLAVVGRRPLAVVLIWAMVATGASVVGEFRTMRVLDAPWSQLLTLQGPLREFAPDEISYDTRSYNLYGRNGYQFYLPEVTFAFFDGNTELPDTDLVISRHEWPLGEAAGARIVEAETRLDEALWVMPGQLQTQLMRQGRIQQPAAVSP